MSRPIFRGAALTLLLFIRATAALAQDATTDETYRPDVARVAVYAQDEWSVTKLWSMYLGARWEAIRVDNHGTGLPETQSHRHVFSPVAQTLYKCQRPVAQPTRQRRRRAGAHAAEATPTLSRYRDDAGASETWGRVPGARRLAVNFEIKL